MNAVVPMSLSTRGTCQKIVLNVAYSNVLGAAKGINVGIYVQA